MGIHNIPDLYRSDDIIYHYTNTKVALLHILPDKTLRLSPRNTSNDPIENTGLFYSFSGGKDVDGTVYESVAYEIKNEVKSEVDRAKQLCLCKNHKMENEQGIRYLPFEKYGFAKPRMWDQYGDHYQGVCLALSKTELIKYADSKSIMPRDIEYITYNDFETRHRSLDITRLKSIGRDAYQNEYAEFIRTRLCQKHKDYVGENEFRFISFAKGSYEYINIQNALKGVIMTDLGLNRKLFHAMQDELSPYEDVHFSIMSFSESGVSIKDTINHFEPSESVKKVFEELQRNN
ncbi:DUF2971 domain-containing protein [Fulvivirga sp. M361]|uniref:DUF2971 domain-containing protein n=1 Tax=Fulvivirga sp. M361 TaxID=2594266 RepID=UPI00117A30BB|nr:DUF2971 domain-containing protein [Fulvivirga sp. M361]TRX51275.1 DUF2971 domain-containing protein [Fulvivirga sp. M361]